MMMQTKLLNYCLATLLFLSACNQGNQLQLSDLKTEGLQDPVGIDLSEPDLSWMTLSSEENEAQTAYHILAASHPGVLDKDQGDLWNSDKVLSDQSQFIKYEGKPLESGVEVFWKVKVWNSDDQTSDWSPVARFSIGLLEPGDWKASWIGLDRAVGNDNPEIENRVMSARYLRKEFQLDKPVKRAMAYIVGLGTYELYLNGEKVDDHVLSPALSEYPKRSYYVTYDLTDILLEGENTVGTILGNGRYFSPRINAPTPTLTYGYPKLLLQISIEFEDGSSTLVVSDDSWKLTADGPILENNEYDGEYYDARKEMPGWPENGYDDSGWMKAELVEPSSPEISSQMIEPMMITETIKPIAVANPQPGIYIYDMGQNMVGWTKLSIQAEEGTLIQQRFAESLKENGTLYLDNIRGARVTDTYIAKGIGTEVFEPRFVFHGFRYVELTGFPGTPDLNTLEGKVIHDDLAAVGDFECSDPLINQIYKNARWGIRGNYRSIPTDCPQRDERQGWLGDRAAGSRGESYLFDIRNFYKKWLIDIFDTQKASGSFSDVCPAYWPFYNDNVTWAGTPIQLVKMLYDQYGDKEIIGDSYDPLKRWVDHMVDSYMEGDLMPRDNYGDWCVPPIDPKLIHTKDPARLTPGEYIGSTFFYHNLGLMYGYANMLGKLDDAKYFNDLAEKMKLAINREFFNPETLQYSNNSATANLLALAFDLVPEEYEQVVFNNLVEKIEVEHHSHMTTGLIGQEFFNRILTKYGRSDLAFTANTQTDYPGYGYMIENGATTIWELWNGNTADPAMNSGNHVMLLGDFLIWLYEDLAGIKPDMDQPGFKHIIMKPELVPALDHVTASHRSPYGWIRSEWKIEGDIFDWKVTVPANSRATLYIPVNDTPEITKSGNMVALDEGSVSGGRFQIEVGSGVYQFTSIIN